MEQAAHKGGELSHDFRKGGTQGEGGGLDTFPPAPSSSRLGEIHQNSRERQTVKRKVSPGIDKIRKIFEKETIEKKTTESYPESRVKKIRNSFEMLMNKEKREKNDREENEREKRKQVRKIKREESQAKARTGSESCVKSTEKSLDVGGKIPWPPGPREKRKASDAEPDFLRNTKVSLREPCISLTRLKV